MGDCVLCRYLDEIRSGTFFRLVHEFDNSYLTVGEHQFFAGYCVLIHKEHIRDLHDLATEREEAFHREMMAGDTRAIAAAYGPAKMNHASYGNAQPHLHWHLFPRYAEDPDRTQTPWLHQARFADFATTTEQAAEVRARLAPYLMKGHG